MAALSAVVERRVWVTTPQGKIWPNIFALMVAPPGGGKSVVARVVTDMIHDMGVDNSRKPRIAPNSMTKSAMVDTLEEAIRIQIIDGQPEEWHSMAIINGEFGVMFPSFDQGFLSHLSGFWDCDRVFEERTRTNKIKRIDNPHVMMLGGIQPRLLSDLFPESAWQQGFFARTVLVYVEESPKTKFFHRAKVDRNLREQLIIDLEKLTDRWGEILISPGAMEAFEAWEAEDFEPAPKHPRMAAYAERRRIHAMKVAILCALAEEHELISLEDFERARFILERAEKNLPGLFLAMGGHAFSMVMDEVVHFVRTEYARTKKAVGYPVLMGFLARKVQPVYVDGILGVLEASGRLRPATPENILTDKKAYVPPESEVRE